MFGGVYHGRRVLVTGHTGFKGSWLLRWLKRLGAEVQGYSLGPVGEPSHWGLFRAQDEGVQEVFADLSDLDRLHAAVGDFQPEVIFHLAAQALVRPSYDDPLGTYQTNVMGTLNLLESVRRVGGVRAVVVVTSDKCYENREWQRGYHEDDAMGGYDPYSSSKGCAELATASFRRSFFHPEHFGGKHQTLIATTRAGNVIGGGDWAVDRLLPDAVRAFQAGEPVQIRKPEATRPWQHVLDPLSGYLLLGQRLLQGEAAYATGWNFGPDQQAVLTVREVLDRFASAMPGLQVDYAEHQPDLHEANALQLDCAKANAELGWTPTWTSHCAIDRAAQWYAAYLGDASLRTEPDLDAYARDAASAGQGWADA